MVDGDAVMFPCGKQHEGCDDRLEMGNTVVATVMSNIGLELGLAGLAST